MIERAKDTTNVLRGEYNLKLEPYNWVALKRIELWASIFYVLDPELPRTYETIKTLQVEEGEDLIIWPPGQGRTFANIALVEEWNNWSANGDGVGWVRSMIPHVVFNTPNNGRVKVRIERVYVNEVWAHQHGATT